MPSFVDEGIIISQKKYGENSLIVKIFSHHHGIYRGFVKAAKSTKNRTIFQVGNLVSFEFRSRIEENLGQFFTVDLVKSFGSKIIFSKLALDCISSLFSIVDERFLERDNHQNLFEKLLNFLEKNIQDCSHKNSIIAEYIKLELEILKTLGYGIDLSSCAVTNNTSNLAFVSPKSGRAVSLQAGIPYEKKLLKLPRFLLEENESCHAEQLIHGFELSGFFLGKIFCEESDYSKNTKDQMGRRARILEALRE